MSRFSNSILPYLLAPVVLVASACESDEDPPAGPLPAVGRVVGDHIVRVLPGQKDSLFTVHADDDGLWLEESSLVGERRFRTRLADDEAALDGLALVPAAERGVIVASREDGFIAVRHIEAGLTWTVGTFVLGDSLLEQSTRIVGVAEPVFDAADLYVEQGGDLLRVRFPVDTASSARAVILDVAEDLAFAEVVGLAGDRVAALSSGEGSAELRIFDGKSEGEREELTPGVGSVARVVGTDESGVYVRVDSEDGTVAVHRAGRDGHAVRTSAWTVAIDADAGGVSEIWRTESGYSLVDSGPIGSAVSRSYWLGAEADLRVDDVVMLPAGRRAVLGQRFGVEGVFIYDPAIAD